MKVFSQLEKAQLENTTSDTGSLPKGMITYRTDLNIAKVSNGTSMLALIDESTAQTLSNKTYASPNITGFSNWAQTTTPANPSAGNNRMYFKADGKLYTLDSAGNEAQVGSGAGGGVVNFITNGNADDTAASIFTTYADAAATRPVDGTGGSPTVTTSITTVSPLNGGKSFLLTKPASNTQGQGWAVPFTVDLTYRAKVVKISADYIVSSGTFTAGSNNGTPTDGDLIWYIYDVTNSQLIEPSNIKMFSNSTSIADRFEATFQTSATGANYRLIAHCASTSALAYELKVDNITVGPQLSSYGTLSTKWIPYTPIFSNLGTPSGVEMFYMLEGTNLKVAGRWTNGTVGAGTATFTLPPVGAVDLPNSRVLGVYGHQGSATGELLVWGGGNLVQFGADNWQVPTTGTQLATSGFTTVNIEVPIVGLGGSVKMSEPGDTRPFSVSLGLTTAQTIPNATVTKVNFDSVWTNTHGTVDTVNKRVSVTSSKRYRIHGQLNLDLNTAVVSFEVVLRVNGTSVKVQASGKSGTGNTYTSVPFDFKQDLRAGDYVEIWANQTSGVSFSIRSDATAGQLSVLHIEDDSSGAQTLAGNDQIRVMVNQTSGQSIPNNSDQTVIFNNVARDTHGIYNIATGRIKLPRAASGTVKCTLASGFTGTGGMTFYAMLYKNGAPYKNLSIKLYDSTLSALYAYAEGSSCDFEGIAGDEFFVAAFQNSGSSRALSTDARLVYADYTLD